MNSRRGLVPWSHQPRDGRVVPRPRVEAVQTPTRDVALSEQIARRPRVEDRLAQDKEHLVL